MRLYNFIKRVLKVFSSLYFDFFILFLFLFSPAVKSKGYEYKYIAVFSLFFISKGISSFLLGDKKGSAFSFLLSWFFVYSILLYIFILEV